MTPSMLEALPGPSFQLEWQLFNRLQSDQGAIPDMALDLSGKGEAAVLVAGSSTGWSICLQTLQLGLPRCESKVAQASEPARPALAGAAA
jgi:hypothetical protein